MGSMETNATNPVQDAVAWAGSQAALAHEMRVHQKTVEKWVERGRVPAPVARLLAILMFEGTSGSTRGRDQNEAALRGDADGA